MDKSLFAVPCTRPQLESAGRTLQVTGAKLEDAGKYTCLATNAAGEVQQHIRLSVHGNFNTGKTLVISPVCFFVCQS